MRTTILLARTTTVAVVAVAVVAAAGDAHATSAGILPARFERYLSTVVRPSTADRARLLTGAPITKLLDAEKTMEVAVFGAIWVNAPRERYVALLKDIETLERGGAYRVTKKIGSPPSLSDFAAVTLPPEDIRDLQRCRVGDCILKMGQPSIDAIRTRVDFAGPTAKADAESFFREQMHSFVVAYRERGNAGLAVYRDAERPTFVAAEFELMVNRMPELTEFLPDLRRYLLGYPAVTLPGAVDFLYWQEVSFGLRPTIRISHLVIEEGPDETIVASKMLYASHYFWTGLELRALVPDPARGPGFWFITVNRSRSDGLSGFTGFFVRRRVRGEVERGILAGLTSTKRTLERTASPTGDR